MEFLKNPATRTTVLCLVVLFLIPLLYFNPLLRGRVLPQSDVIKAKGMQKNIDDYRKLHNQEPYWSTSMFSGMPAQPISIRYSGNIMDGVRHVLGLGLPYPIGFFFVGMALFFFLLRVGGVSPWLAVAGGVGYGLFTYFIMIVEAGHVNKFEALMMAPGVLLGIVLAFNGRLYLGVALMALWLGLQIYFNHVQMTYYMLLVVVAYVVWQFVKAIREKMLAVFIKISAVLGVGAVLAVAVNAVPLYPLYEYTQYTIRGPSELKRTPDAEKTGGLDRDYAYGWSYGRDELVTLLVPNAMGGGSGSPLTKDSEFYKALRKENLVEAYQQQLGNSVNYYWGTQPFTGGPFYLGAVIILFAVVGLILLDGGIKWVLLYATLLSLLLSLGKYSYSVAGAVVILLLPAIYYFTKRFVKQIPEAVYATMVTLLGFFIVNMTDGDPATTYRFADLWMDYMPLYNKFRVPSSILIVAALAVPWLAMLGAQALLDDARSKQERSRALIHAAGIVGGVCLVLWIAPSLFFNFEGPNDKASGLPPNLVRAMVADRESMLQADAFRNLCFVLGAFGLIFGLFLRSRLAQPAVLTGVIAFLITADLWVVNKRLLADDGFVRKQQFEAALQPREADQLIKQDSGYFRVYPISRNPFNDGLTPYHLNSLGGYNAAKIRRYQQLREAHLSPEDGRVVPNVVCMLNTRYVIHNQDMKAPWLQKVHTTQDGEQIYVNQYNYGPAWITQKVIVADGPDAALDTLDNVMSIETAVIEKKDEARLGKFSADAVDAKTESVLLTKHDNREMVYQYASDKDRFVTFSEVYYDKGWTATIDDQPAPILHTNFVLRGLVVPAGKHTVRFYYEPKSIKISETVSLASSVLLVLLACAAGFVEWRKAAKKPAQ
jgi:hypothetical protein